jgi:hypothetical protein
MRIRVGIPDDHVTPEVVEPVLEAVTRLNEHMIRTGQSPTSHEALAAGAIWRPENMGDEHFDHGGTIASRGWGDCDDWAPLHAATLRANGTDPGAKSIMVPSGPNTFHAIVQRSNGAIEDPSIAAGMKSRSPSNLSGVSVIGENGMQVWACDPHDGRIYQGALAATVGPLSLHCGPGLALRGVNGCYEARVDLPIQGSPLVAVRSYARHKGHKHRHAMHGAVPYALSVTHIGPTPGRAMHGAIVGAICCGDASEMASNLDRYKLLALQSAMAGMSPGQVHDALVRQMHADVHAQAAQSGLSPEQHASELAMHAASVSGERFPGSQSLVGGLFGDLESIASSVVSDVSKVASTVAKDVLPWAGTIIHGIQAAVSVVPGLGTAVSDVIAAAETAYEAAAALVHGNFFEAAIHSAYNFATASIPGASALRPMLDPVVNTLIGLTVKKEPIDSGVLDALLSNVPDTPQIGPLSPRSIAASLAHLIVAHLGLKHNPKAGPPKSKPAAHPPHPAIVKVPPKKPPAKLPDFSKLNFSQVNFAAAAATAARAKAGPGLAHAAIHKVTLKPVNAMVQHV